MSSSPSSTPTDCSETHSNIIGQVLLQTSNNVINHTPHTSEVLVQDDEEVAPPITKRPERTKSIVSRCNYSLIGFIIFNTYIFL